MTDLLLLIMFLLFLFMMMVLFMSIDLGFMPMLYLLDLLSMRTDRVEY